MQTGITSALSENRANLKYPLTIPAPKAPDQATSLQVPNDAAHSSSIKTKTASDNRLADNCLIAPIHFGYQMDQNPPVAAVKGPIFR